MFCKVGVGHVQAGRFRSVVCSAGSSQDFRSLIRIDRKNLLVVAIGILAFLNYLPYSKHFHILLAFPNTYYSNLETKVSSPTWKMFHVK